MSCAARPSVLAHWEHRRMLDWADLQEPRVSYPRRQQYRRLSHSGAALAGSTIVAFLAFMAAGVGAVSLAGLLVVAAVAIGLSERHWLILAEVRRVGARSGDDGLRSIMHFSRVGV